MAVSIKDIAREAGVSHSTVSRALADSPLVNPKTKARIQELAREMSYAPSAIARAMATRRTRTVGLVVTTIADPFVAEIVRGIEETALDHDHNVILCSSNDDPDRELNAVRTLREKWVDAVIVTSSRVGSFYEELTEIRVPVVLINSQQPGDYSLSVRNDDLYGGRLVGEYLISLEHRRIAYIAGREDTVSSQLRLRGCQEALAQAGLHIPAEWIVAGDGTPAAGDRAARQLLTTAPCPSAIFCYNDQTAMGALRGAKSRGYAIPDDLSIVGYDDIPAAAYLDPPLTTVAQAKYEMGRHAMGMALELLAKRDVRDVLLRPGLVLRASCAVPRDERGPRSRT
ncbi:MAG TPA: LacI family DNA-binding transcriptional regulator [Anaerolineae bacterium]|nr:LacI family DNA-binding transcriptional regulator [Anaerolineae bacterium]